MIYGCTLEISQKSLKKGDTDLFLKATEVKIHYIVHIKHENFRTNLGRITKFSIKMHILGMSQLMSEMNYSDLLYKVTEVKCVMLYTLNAII